MKIELIDQGRSSITRMDLILDHHEVGQAIASYLKQRGVFIEGPYTIYTGGNPAEYCRICMDTNSSVRWIGEDAI